MAATKTEPNKQVSQVSKLSKLNELIKEIRMAMLTTAMPDGSLRSRPMATQQSESDGELWFFTWASAAKAEEVLANPQVNISYSCAKSNHYVSVSGTAMLVRDRKKMEELWSPLYRAWFPKGLEEPDIGLLKVKINKAEYWDAPSGMMADIAGLFLGPAVAENEKIDLTGSKA
jgi:general stress protein 26